MPDELEALPATPPPRRRRGRWLLGCLAAALFVCCGGPIALFSGIGWYVNKSLRQDLDRAHAEALASGDAEAAYDGADPAFRRVVSRDAFQEFARRHPELFQRDRLTANRSTSSYSNGVQHRAVRVTVAAAAGAVTLTLYFRERADGRLALLGIGPDLAAAVPAEVVRQAESTGGTTRRRSRLRRLFD